MRWGHIGLHQDIVYVFHFRMTLFTSSFTDGLTIPKMRVLTIPELTYEGLTVS